MSKISRTTLAVIASASLKKTRLLSITLGLIALSLSAAGPAWSQLEQAIIVDIDKTLPSSKYCEALARVWLDISGNKITLNESNPGCLDVWVYDLATDKTVKLPDSPYHKMNAKISGSTVVWVDERYGDAPEIMLYDLITEEERRLTSNPAADVWPVISDRYIAWPRQSTAQPRAIYAVDRNDSDLTEFKINLPAGSYPDPFMALSGTQLVWIDTSGGTGDDQVMVSDLATGTHQKITTGPTFRVNPDISRDLVVWADYRHGDWEIYRHDLASGIETRVTTDPADQWGPVVSGDVVVWNDERNGNDDVYMLDLSAGVEVQLTDEPHAQILPAIDGDKIVWLDFRSGQAEVYIFSSGYTRTGTDVRVVPEDTTSGDTPVSVTFAEVLVEGTTTVTAYEQGPPPDAGFKFGNPPIYYDVATTAEYESPLIVCFNYEEARFGNEDQLDIRHYEDTNGDGSPDQWVDATYSLDTVNNIICALVDSLSLFAVTEPDGSPEPEVVEVTVDIKPGSEPNCINNDGHGVIPVAVLGSADFSVRQIDPMSVALAALTIKVVGKNEKLLVHYEDVNGDGQEDLVAQVEDMDGVFSVGDSTATLTGTLYDGTLIEGTDSLCIVP